MDDEAQQDDASCAGAAVQYAALCWRAGRKGAEVLLVTSRETGRWVVPKGWPIKSLTGSATAAREAWEEAGAKGEVAVEPLGFFLYDKVLHRDRKEPPVLPCRVAVFPLHVAELFGTYPEREQRKRKWFSPLAASRKVDEPDLRDLIARFAPASDTRKRA